MKLVTSWEMNLNHFPAGHQILAIMRKRKENCKNATEQCGVFYFPHGFFVVFFMASQNNHVKQTAQKG